MKVELSIGEVRLIRCCLLYVSTFTTKEDGIPEQDMYDIKALYQKLVEIRIKGMRGK